MEIKEIQSQHLRRHKFSQVHHTNTYQRGIGGNRKQSGGVSTFLDNKSANKYNGTTNDKYGRWQTIRLLANKAEIVFTTVYRPCKENKKTMASNWDNLKNEFNRNKVRGNPEDKTVDHLREHLEEELNKGNYVCVMADANEQYSKKPHTMNGIMEELGMINVFHDILGGKVPPTQSESQGAIDHIWISRNLVKCVRDAGIAPLNYIITSDHRALIVDFDFSEISTSDLYNLQPYEKRKFKSSDVKGSSVFIEGVDEQMEKQGIDNRFVSFRKMKKDGTAEEVVHDKMESIKQQMLDIGVSEERKLASHKSHPWSPTFHKSIKNTYKKRNKLEHLRNTKATRDPERHKKACEKAYDDYKRALEEHKEILNNVQSLRDMYLLDLADALTKNKTFKNKETAIKVLQHIEKQRNEARKIKSVLKPVMNSKLTYVLIPAKCNYPPLLRQYYKDPLVIWNRIEQKNAKDIKKWEAILEKQELEELLIGWQCLHFSQAGDTPLASADWEKIIETCNTVEEIQEKFEVQHEELDDTTKMFLEELYKVKEGNGEIFEDMTLEDFKLFIRNKDEKQLTSPSGRHLGHFKVLVDHKMMEYIFELIKSFIELCYTPKRWRKTVCALIEKDEGKPYLHRLRTIHIVESEIQFIANFYWSKWFLKYCEQQEDHITDTQHGGRKGRMGWSALVQQLLQEHPYRIPCRRRMSKLR